MIAVAVKALEPIFSRPSLSSIVDREEQLLKA